MNEKLTRFKQKITLDPIMALLIISVIVLLLSFIFSLLNIESSYNVLNPDTGEYSKVLVSVKNLLNFDGIKYLFSTTVSSFMGFAPLSSLIIILIGIGIMEGSGFLKTSFTLLTKYTKRNTLTFFVVLICVLSSICGEISYVILIPLVALLYKYGKRNPKLGIITAFAGLISGTGISLLLNSIDSSLLKSTLASSHVLDVNYIINNNPFLFIMLIATIAMTIGITYISEKIIALKLDRYVVPKEEYEIEISKKDLKGLVFGLSTGILFLLIIIYSIIPGLPLSGSLLDNTKSLYIDKLFSPDSFFNMGFLFIIMVLFIIMGLFYGIGAKTVKNNNDFCHYLGHSLDSIGKTLIMILIASLLVNIFIASNIGNVIIGALSNLINGTSATGILLIILIFFVGAIGTLFVPSSITKWKVLSGVTVPVAMNAGLSPEFAQVIYRFGETFTIGITPIFSYFIIFLAFLELYNQDKRPVNLMKSISYMLPYSLFIGIVLLVLAIGWYLIGLPIGISTLTVI